MMFGLLISFIPFVFLIALPINSCVKVSSEGPMHQRAWDRYLSGYGHASCAPMDARESRLVLCVHGRTIDYFHRRTECAPGYAQMLGWTMCVYGRADCAPMGTKSSCVHGRAKSLSAPMDAQIRGKVSYVYEMHSKRRRIVICCATWMRKTQTYRWQRTD